MASTSGRYVVGRASDLPDGGVMVVEAGNRRIAVFHVGDGFYAVIDRCPHRGAPLSQGRLGANITSDRPGSFTYHEEERYLMCPWHGWEFDLATGQSYLEPTRVRSRPLPVGARSGAELLEEMRSGHPCVDPSEYATYLQEDLDVRSDDAINRVPGPYKVDTVDVHVEDDYLILEFGRPPEASRSADQGEEQR